VRLAEGYAMALSPDGRWAIVQTEATHLDLIPTGPGQARRLNRPGLSPLDARWVADGQHVVVRARPEGGQPRLYLLDLEGRTTRPVTPEGVAVGRTGWAVSPDGTMVALSVSK
jgi:hypothetical protein